MGTDDDAFQATRPRHGQSAQAWGHRARPFSGSRRRVRDRKHRAGEGGAMIEKLIRWSVTNRLLFILATLFVVAGGIWAIRTMPIDALPDLSDVQVIIRTTFPGQAP